MALKVSEFETLGATSEARIAMMTTTRTSKSVKPLRLTLPQSLGGYLPRGGGADEDRGVLIRNGRPCPARQLLRIVGEPPEQRVCVEEEPHAPLILP